MNKLILKQMEVWERTSKEIKNDCRYLSSLYNLKLIIVQIIVKIEKEKNSTWNQDPGYQIKSFFCKFSSTIRFRKKLNWVLIISQCVGKEVNLIVSSFTMLTLHSYQIFPWNSKSL